MAFISGRWICGSVDINKQWLWKPFAHGFSNNSKATLDYSYPTIMAYLRIEPVYFWLSCVAFETTVKLILWNPAALWNSLYLFVNADCSSIIYGGSFQSSHTCLFIHFIPFYPPNKIIGWYLNNWLKVTQETSYPSKDLN